MKMLQRLKQQTSRARQGVQRHPKIAIGAVAAVVLLGLIAVVMLPGGPDFEDLAPGSLFGEPSFGEASERAAKNPKDADAQLALGHAAFKARRRAVALAAYENALVLDRKIADDTLYQNVVSCFGTKHQESAASLITRFHLVGIADRLDDLAKHESYGVRWAALQTLSRIGKASRADFVSAWIGDLDSKECDVRRAAVENLGKQGDPRALQAIRTARATDRQNPGWFGATCLGGLPDEAEKKILARR